MLYYAELYVDESEGGDADADADNNGNGGAAAAAAAKKRGEGKRFEKHPDLCAINAVSREKAAAGTSALRLAAARGFAPLVARLLEFGASPAVAYDVRDACGRVAMHDIARAPFHWEAPWRPVAPEAILENREHRPDKRAAMQPYALALLALPQKGCVDLADLDGATPLHYACAHGAAWLVRLLTRQVPMSSRIRIGSASTKSYRHTPARAASHVPACQMAAQHALRQVGLVAARARRLPRPPQVRRDPARGARHAARLPLEQAGAFVERLLSALRERTRLLC